jgi:DNA mismatch repair ATPase MutS
VFQLRGAKREFNNLFYSIFNALYFIDIYLLLLSEKWKQENASSFESWSAAISEFEALSSIAGFHFANSSFVFPQITCKFNGIHFEKVGHPLIGEDKRITNDFALKDSGEIAIITGSNMAGKSTFLRTVGVNIVLGLMGAPCCASAARLSNIALFSSLRTQDNLHEGVSSFYAELKRVEQLLALANGGQASFFLLDEMFKGTNSKDGRLGAFSLTKQLKELGASGIISTHDLDFAALAGKAMDLPNYSFNSSLQNDDLVFDYKLTNGLCRDFNASALMEKSGIHIIPDASV